MIKTLAASIRQYKKVSALAMLFTVLEVGLDILIPRLMADLIDKGIEPGRMNVVLGYGAVLLVSAVLALTFGALGGRYAARAACGLARNLRQNMYYKVQDFSFSNIDRFSTASIVTRLTTDVTNVQMAYQMIVRLAIRCPVMLVVAMIVSFSIHRELSLIFLGAAPLLFIGLYIIMRLAHPVFERVFRTYDKLNQVVQENLRGIRVVKSFTREDYENQKFDNISQSIYKDFSKAEKTLAFNMPLMQAAMYACTLLLCWMGARVIVLSGGTELTTGLLMSLFNYALQILMSLMALSMVLVMITISRASAERIVEILTEESDLKNGPDPVYTVKDGSIDFTDVLFSYARKAERPVLNHVDLHIASGQTVGILGGTGSSKSSLVQLIPRLYDVTGGSVKVGGVDVRDYDLETLRNQVAMVLQKNVLFSGTIKENLRWGDEHATDEQMVHACQLACADEFIQQMPDGYDTYIEQGGANVSGGQKQRLCIARALLKKPKILILDDSTSAVDTETDARIRRAFAQEIPDTTKIIIAQRVSSIQDADQIVVLDAGRIVGLGTHAQLLQSCDIYREAYESQNKKGGDQNG